MQKIIPNLWFKGVAKDAVNFYLSIFPESKINQTQYYPTEGLLDFQRDLAGKILTIEFELWGYKIVGINAGPEFTPNPSCSFMVNFDPSRNTDAEALLDNAWAKLVEGGKILMPLQEYGFSKKYGWVEDKYGFSWQLILTNPEGEPRPNIISALLFVTDDSLQAEEAVKFYLSTFKETSIGSIVKYPTKVGHISESPVMYSDFVLEGSWFVAMDGSTIDHRFKFNEAFSFAIFCKDQQEIDYYWDKITKDGGQESVCGWCKDKFGLSWQVVPLGINELVSDPKSFSKMLTMKKIIMDDLK